MGNFFFYTEIGFKHVMDLQAYDHILFLAALGLPFTFRDWRQVLWLVTVFTTTHCVSLAMAVYGLVSVSVELVEFLIPVTIAITALVNLLITGTKYRNLAGLHLVLTGFFGLIHGLGFSNYFKMLMAGEAEKLSPLLGFATGIELAQVVVVLLMLSIGYLVVGKLNLGKSLYIIGGSILIVLITIPLMINAFPL